MKLLTKSRFGRFAFGMFGLIVSHFLLGASASAQESATAPANEETEAASADKDEPAFLRIDQTDEKRSRALQTAILHYVGKAGTPYDGQSVDLVGVVHVGQKGYYADLKQRLAKYDTVLYELVAPDGTRIRPEDLEGRRSVLSSMQTGMKDILNLEYQLEQIDYMAANFRHADMSPEEFVDDFSRRGDSLWKMGARMMGAGLATQAATGGEAGLLMALFSDDRSRRMKQVMARQMVDMEAVTAGIDDANGENTLIKSRNAKAFEILKDELDQGKKNVAVFYGAGHLPDMAERLEKQFEMEKKSTTWLDGWDLTRN
nr:TraB/GumN family protein [Novipirellula artificiosorum]